MSNFKFEVKGADKLLTKLKEGAKYEDVKNAVKINTAELARNAITNAPVDSGFLERSILPEYTDLVGRVYSYADYAMYVEVGTRFMAAQPYMAPAMMIQRLKFLNDLKRLMK